jgi:hypothetical protein
MCRPEEEALAGAIEGVALLPGVGRVEAKHEALTRRTSHTMSPFSHTRGSDRLPRCDLHPYASCFARAVWLPPSSGVDREAGTYL